MRIRLCSEQTRFLRAVAQTSIPFDELLIKLKLDPDQLNTWLKGKHFRLALSRAVKLIHRKRELELELLANRAVRKLGEILDGAEVSNVLRRTCFDLINRPRRVQQSNELPPPTSPFHPDVDPEEAQTLIDQMQNPTDSPNA
ncbi:MAG TPA: hypothetical protein VGF52_00480 [Tepidisphaeraceae bacterium]